MSRRNDAPRRCSRVRVRSLRSARTGTAISAAAVGVGARRSAARSMSVVSVSWPTADIRGISLAAAARTTISSLKAHRSSRLPPPRATISTSGRGTAAPASRRLKPAIAAAISSAAPAPWTLTGQTRTRRGKRSSMPVQDVADHGARGRGHDAHGLRQVGQVALSRLVEEAFGGECLLARLQQREQGAGARKLQPLNHDLDSASAPDRC